MADRAGLTLESLHAGYWRHRNDYDAGLSGRQYWTRIIGDVPDEAALAELVHLDAQSWLVLDQGTVELIEELQSAGVPTSLLSNAPLDFANAVRDHQVLAGFHRLLFSAELGMIKPDPQIFETACELIGSSPEYTIFIDDRLENVQAAFSLGMQTILHRDAAETRSLVFQYFK